MDNLTQKELKNLKEWFSPERRKIINVSGIEHAANVRTDCLSQFINKIRPLPIQYIPGIVKQIELLGYEPVKLLDIDYIQDIVCKYFKIPRKELNKKTRKRKIIKARQIAMYFSREFKFGSFSYISKIIAGQQSSNCQQAIKTVNNLIFSDIKYANDIEILRKKFNHDNIY